jgi:predicted transcriptional regulator
MNLPRVPRTRPVRHSARYEARLDTETHAKLEDFARTFHRKRSAVLRCVMQWGLTQTQGWTVDTAVPGTVHTLSLLLELELLQQVQEAASAQGATVAAWVRQVMREVRSDDFPASWRAGVVVGRSHDSQTYGQRFMLRLDETTAQKLQELVAQFGMSRAAIIRQLIAQAKAEDFLPGWQLVAVEQQRFPSG